MNVLIHPLAKAELYEAIEYFESKRPGYGALFRREFEKTLDRVIANPETWQELKPGVRTCRMRVFRYILLYRFRENEISLFAVAHPSRKPAYWNSRL